MIGAKSLPTFTPHTFQPPHVSPLNEEIWTVAIARKQEQKGGMESDSLNRFMNRRILVLHRDTSAATAARALHENGFGSAVISDRHGHMVGIVTDRDLTCSVLAFGLSPETPIAEVMTSQVIAASPTTRLDEVATMMEVNGVRRIPIVQKEDTGKERCLGMVTLDDLLSCEALKDCESLARIVRSQITRSPPSMPRSGRKEDRREQVINHFYKCMCRHMKLPRETCERLTFFLLKRIVQRLPYTEADHFIAQLPSLIQEDLRSLPAGPDRDITADTILNEVVAGFQLEKRAAYEGMHSFWRGLMEVVDHGLLLRLENWLPIELRRVFVDGLLPATIFSEPPNFAGSTYPPPTREAHPQALNSTPPIE